MPNFLKYSVGIVRESNKRYDISKKADCPESIRDIMSNLVDIPSLAEEYMYVISLDTKKNFIGCSVLSQGTLNASIAHPREIFKRAIVSNAHSIILVHNHPSGDTNPSSEDIAVTQRIKDCGLLMDIPLVDHIILGYENDSVELYSFKRGGNL